MALLAESGLADSKPRSESYTSPASLALLAGVPVLVALWALLSPGLVLSSEMTWDFLYNLSGAWHLQHGHVAHVDFHEPVGQLNFMLTLLGFELVGPTPFAFLVGVAIVAAVVFVSASAAAMRRLPVPPAALFVIFASLLVLMPANVGDTPNAYSFAMSYNRYGWSLLCILALILFVPPRDRVAGDWIDVANAGLLLAALFYLKVTYFAGGLAFVGLAVLISPHIRAHLSAWLAIGAFVLSQNHQSHGLPVGIVIAFLLYDQIRERFGSAVPVLPMLMVFPLFAIGTSALSLQGYHARAGREALLQVVDRTQLKGLAVPGERRGLLAAFAEGWFGHALLNRSRATQPRFELSPAEYVETIVEAAALLGDGRHCRGGVVVLDQVNPFPFMLGWPPPRGGNLWSGPGAPVRPAGEVFAEAEHVLIPKFSSYSIWTEQARRDYGPYLSENFRVHEETQSWIVLSREGTVTPRPDGRTPCDIDRGPRIAAPPL